MEMASLSVTEVNNYIKNLLDSDLLLSGLSIKGELSNYKIYPSGHHYFTLKDAESSIRCVMFKSNASKLSFVPEAGMGVTAMGRISVYPRDGAYQLYCTGLLQEGQGDLHAAFEKLKEKLAKEGLFDAEYKKPLPRFPKTIAVITSSAGAAVRDIIRVLGKRWPMTKLVILPVRVQGAEAPAEIAGAIRYADKHKVADLIITGRGGGSIEDLWAFNDEGVARAIFACETPIISAVGHEPDVTIADYVADLRAATPSNAAELAVPDQSEMQEAIYSYEQRLAHSMGKQLEANRARLTDLSSRRVLLRPTAYIDQKRQELDSLSEALLSRYERGLHKRKQDYIRLAASLDALSPLKVLSRGYAMTTDENGRAVSSVSTINKGDKLNVSLSDGRLLCTVTDKKKLPIEKKAKASTKENKAGGNTCGDK